jgi:ssRNA-specific RNase YbeY (16S rRNA maturation enzyme)
LRLLVVHGGLHLCGWDHIGERDRREMWARERELLERHAQLPAADPWVEPPLDEAGHEPGPTQ